MIRDKLYSPKNNPHEDRFNYIDYPTVSSKHKYVFFPAIQQPDLHE